MDIAVALTTFLLIVPVELPDKTFVATLVLATRYRPLPTWIGVGLAFAVQCLIAVTLGGLLTRLPHRPVTAAAGVLFLVGALVLWRGAAQADTEEAETEQEFEGKLRQGVSGLRAVGASFLVLFLAEWGDLSQLLTAGLVVRYQDPVSVFAGAWLALLLVSGIGAIAGRTLLRFVRLSRVRRIGATVCAVLAVLTLLSAAGVPTPV
ncbi:MAG: TMEM165/GDT1 family protein [Kineosporiaceae bacterium]|nr:TMEM165/GDT1 family protein [Kineosporiaceae bacterium]MBK8077982.1 TMEM165/GDT1 family protein [Kineosporiaceae bacterium]